jgi:hypothetical protein
MDTTYFPVGRGYYTTEGRPVTWPLYCHVSVGRGNHLARCNQRAHPGLTVCDKHVEQHEHWLARFVADLFGRRSS